MRIYDCESQHYPTHIHHTQTHTYALLTKQIDPEDPKDEPKEHAKHEYVSDGGDRVKEGLYDHLDVIGSNYHLLSVCVIVVMSACV
jgi:hypothetical protein